MQWIKQTKQLVHDGIYVANLRLMVAAASRGMEIDARVIPTFVIRQIALSVLDMWEGRPLRQREHRIVEEGLRPSFEALLDAMLKEASREDIINLAEALIKAWQSVQGELQDLADLTGE
jgi:hypothetical protein